MFFGSGFEKVDAFLGEGEGDFDLFFLENEIFWFREEVFNNFGFDRLISVFSGFVHRFSFLCASSRRR